MIVDEDEVLLGRAKELINVLDSYIRQGLPMVNAQTMRDILDVNKPYEGETPPVPVEGTE